MMKQYGSCMKQLPFSTCPYSTNGAAKQNNVKWGMSCKRPLMVYKWIYVSALEMAYEKYIFVS